MKDEGLRSIDYLTATHSVVLVYEPDTPYDVKEIMAYVNDMTDGTTTSVMIYEADRLMCHMKLMGGAGWVDVVANKLVNGI